MDNGTSYVGYLWLLQMIQNITTVTKTQISDQLIAKGAPETEEQKYDVNDKHTCKIK